MKYLTEAEEELRDFRRGNGIRFKAKIKALKIKQTKEAPHELVVLFRLFGDIHNISPDEMCGLMQDIAKTRSRQLVHTVFSIASEGWREFIDAGGKEPPCKT